MGKIIYGLKNVKYAIWDADSGTYGAYKTFADGVVSLSSDAEANSTDFYASDTVYATIDAVAKETGSIEVAYITDDVLKDLFGYDEDTSSGLMYVDTEPKAISVALSYEVSGNEGKQRGVRYNVTFQRPSQSANTMTESISPDTVTLNYTAVGRDFVINGETHNVLKGHVNEGKAGYASFFNAVVMPGVAVVEADCTLSALTIGSLTLSPTFDADNLSYTTTTTNTKDAVTATATESSDATVVIRNGVTAIESGADATWEAGANTVTITVINGMSAKVYTVIVTKNAS